MNLILAQSVPTPDEAIGWAERMNKGGVPVIALCVAIASVLAVVFLFKKLLEKEEENTLLEATYRKDLEDRHKQALADAERRVSEAKQEAKDRAAEIDKLMRERMAAEKESDAIFAQAIRVLDANTKLLERVERFLDGGRAP